MFLAHERRDKSGTWEVAWMWLPHFLASDMELHKSVGQKMTHLFKGESFEETPPTILLQRMHEQVINLILEKYPIPGLRQYLEAVIHLDPEETETCQDTTTVS